MARETYNDEYLRTRVVLEEFPAARVTEDGIVFVAEVEVTDLIRSNTPLTDLVGDIHRRVRKRPTAS